MEEHWEQNRGPVCLAAYGLVVMKQAPLTLKAGKSTQIVVNPTSLAAGLVQDWAAGQAQAAVSSQG